MNHIRSIVLSRRRVEIGIALSLGAFSALALPTPVRATPPPVINCDDSGTGSFRAALSDPATHTGDIVDMSALTCGRIDLQTPLLVAQSTLTIIGTGRDAFVISANGRDRVIVHGGSNTLALRDLTVSEGHANGDGGCIESSGNVVLSSAIVANCVATLSGIGGSEHGGGLWVAGALRLYDSIIRDNIAGSARSVRPKGGGAYVGASFESHDSTVSGNTADGATTEAGEGGGIAVYSDASLVTTTFSANRAGDGGALLLAGAASASATIDSSTISGNRAIIGAAAIFSKISVTIANSTIVGNHTEHARLANHVFGAVTVTDAVLDLESSIISGNEIIDGVVAADVTANGNALVVGAADNFVSASNAPIPGGLRSDCPRLGPLAANGRQTRTHAVLAGSSLVDQGDADASLIEDQRGANRHVRMPDIGSVERQDGEIDDRLLASAFEPVCDI